MVVEEVVVVVVMVEEVVVVVVMVVVVMVVVDETRGNEGGGEAALFIDKANKDSRRVELQRLLFSAAVAVADWTTGGGGVGRGIGDDVV